MDEFRLSHKRKKTEPNDNTKHLVEIHVFVFLKQLLITTIVIAGIQPVVLEERLLAHRVDVHPAQSRDVQHRDRVVFLQMNKAGKT